MRQRSNSGVVAGTLLLSASSIFVRMIGFLFKIYLSNTIGADGMGLYTLIMSIYSLGVTIALSGVSTAVSKLVAEELGRCNYENARRVLRKAVSMSLFLGIFVFVCMFFSADPVSVYILKDPRCALSLKLLAPGMPLLALSACLRGYFIASRNMVNPACAQVLEQLFKMGFIIILLGYWMPRGTDYACAAVVLGITFGELVCFVYTMLGYAAEKKHVVMPGKAVIKGVTAQILRIIIPVSLAGYVRSGLRLLEDVLIISGLRSYIGEGVAATEAYGLVKGMVMPLLIFPLSLMSSFVITLTPEISRLEAARDSIRLERIISRILQVTCIVGIFIVGVFVAFSYEIGLIVYNSGEAGQMLRQMAFLCPFMCIEMVVVSILYGLGEQTATMRYSIIDCVLRVIIVYALVPRKGVEGFIIMVAFSNLLTSALNLNRLLGITRIRLQINDWVVKPALAALSAGQAVKVILNLYLFKTLTMWQGLALGFAVLMAVYVLVLFSVGSINRGDFAWIKPILRFPSKSPKNSPEIVY